MKRLLSDIWIMFRHHIWNMWRQQRYLSKLDRDIQKMEKEKGICYTFLHHFEANMNHYPEELVKEILNDFFYEVSQHPEVMDEEDYDSIVQYANKYGVRNVPNR